tara:strand:- start:6819 stop:7430 length:612 start_codon:yes stop_codon:yes gene_type:complete
MIKMAYRKRNKGAELSIRQDSNNTIDISTHYYNKSAYYDIDLKDKTTEITYCTRKVTPGHKTVKWRENWLGNRFINFELDYNNETWYGDISSYSFALSKKVKKDGIHIGNDFTNIQHCKFIDKVGSALNSLLKQAKDEAIIPHPENEYDKRPLRWTLAKEVLESCIDVTAESHPHLLPVDPNTGYEYTNILDIVQPEREDLPF